MGMTVAGGAPLNAHIRGGLAPPSRERPRWHAVVPEPHPVAAESQRPRDWLNIEDSEVTLSPGSSWNGVPESLHGRVTKGYVVAVGPGAVTGVVTCC